MTLDEARERTEIYNGSLRVRTRFPAVRRRSFVVGLWEGFAVVVTLLWCFKGRWKRSAERGEPGWHAWPIAGAVVAFRVEW